MAQLRSASQTFQQEFRSQGVGASEARSARLMLTAELGPLGTG